MEVSRIVRGETLKIKENEYCLLLNTGIKTRNILLRHIVLNLKETIVVAVR